MANARSSGRAAVQLGAFTCLVYVLRIERLELFELLVCATLGFVVLSLAPASLRHAIFLATSIAAGCVTIGPTYAAVILGTALAIIGIVWLPIPVRWRALAIAFLLAAMVQLRRTHPDLDFWPILGSIFAVRGFLFLHDSARGVTKMPLFQQLSYFVLLPNFALPLFPLVGYRTFVTSYRERPSGEDLDRGGTLLLVGLAHLIGYRLAFHYLVLDPAPTLSILDRVRYVLGFAPLYLRVSGTFHIAIGLLHFFGYRLPVATGRYWASRNLLELWRRLDTYWKAVTTTYVFVPIARTLRRYTTARAVPIAMFLTVIASWAMHAYLFLFVRGTLRIEGRDFLVWLFLAVATAVTATLAKPVRRSRMRSALGIAAMFVMTCLVWSVWAAPTWGEWTHVVLGLADAR